MLNAIRTFFSPPVFEDEERSRSAYILNIILWSAFSLLAILQILSYSSANSLGEFLLNPISILAIVIAVLIFVMKLGFISQASFILLIASWAALTAQSYTYHNGIYDSAFLATTLLILLAGLLLDFRYSILFAILSILTGWGLAYSQTNSNLPLQLSDPLSVARDYTAIFTLLTLLTYLIISGLRNAVTIARENEQKQIKANLELRELQTSLEEHIAARTADLEESKLLSEKHTRDLEAVAEISHSMVSIQDIDELLPTITLLISQHYGFYHAGIYLIDEAGKYAVLSAASSEGGLHMLESQHKLRVEPTSLVGFAASRGQIRVSADVSRDTIYMALPELPDTKSEVVLPLIAGTQTIGVLDVESTQPNAFSERDVNILNTLANLAAVSIQNTRSFEETRHALAESEKIYQQFVQQGWQRISKEFSNLGYRYTQDGTVPLNTPGEAATPEPSTPDSAEGSAPNPEAQPAFLTIPIRLRNQTIGSLRVRSTGLSREWDEDEMAMIRATAERAALALENARLLEDSRQRASKERVISEIGAKITSSISVDSILKTAVGELGNIIPDTDIFIQFVSGDELDE